MLSVALERNLTRRGIVIHDNFRDLFRQLEVKNVNDEVKKRINRAVFVILNNATLARKSKNTTPVTALYKGNVNVLLDNYSNICDFSRIKIITRHSMFQSITSIQGGKGMMKEDDFRKLIKFCTLNGDLDKGLLRSISGMQKGKGMIKEEDFNKLIQLCTVNGDLDKGLLRSITGMQNGKGIMTDDDFNKLNKICSANGSLDKELLRSISSMQNGKGMIKESEFKKLIKICSTNGILDKQLLGSVAGMQHGKGIQIGVIEKYIKKRNDLKKKIIKKFGSDDRYQFNYKFLERMLDSLLKFYLINNEMLLSYIEEAVEKSEILFEKITNISLSGVAVNNCDDLYKISDEIGISRIASNLIIRMKGKNIVGIKSIANNGKHEKSNESLHARNESDGKELQDRFGVWDEGQLSVEGNVIDQLRDFLLRYKNDLDNGIKGFLDKIVIGQQLDSQNDYDIIGKYLRQYPELVDLLREFIMR